jgi:hypothetical protein
MLDRVGRISQRCHQDSQGAEWPELLSLSPVAQMCHHWNADKGQKKSSCGAESEELVFIVICCKEMQCLQHPTKHGRQTFTGRCCKDYF